MLIGSICGPISGPVESQDAIADRQLRRLDADRCYAELSRLGVRYERPETAGVAIPVRLQSAVRAVEIEFVGRRRSNAVIDCRAVLALDRFAEALHEAGLTKMRHLSAYRAGARHRRTGRPSGHASGLAVDLRYFEFGDDEVFDVLEHWQPRTRGSEPCAMVDGEAPRSRLIRTTLCRAIERGLFQVVVTPHHDDHHANHLHVEVVPDVPWTWVR